MTTCSFGKRVSGIICGSNNILCSSQSGIKVTLEDKTMAGAARVKFNLTDKCLTNYFGEVLCKCVIIWNIKAHLQSGVNSYFNSRFCTCANSTRARFDFSKNSEFELTTF